MVINSCLRWRKAGKCQPVLCLESCCSRQTEQSEPASGGSHHLARPFCLRPHPGKIRAGVKGDICSSAAAHRRQNPGLRLLHTILSKYTLLFGMTCTSVYPIIAAAVFLENPGGVFSTERWTWGWGVVGFHLLGNWIVHHGGLGPPTVISSFHQTGVNHNTPVGSWTYGSRYRVKSSLTTMGSTQPWWTDKWNPSSLLNNKDLPGLNNLTVRVTEDAFRFHLFNGWLLFCWSSLLYHVFPAAIILLLMLESYWFDK